MQNFGNGPILNRKSGPWKFLQAHIFQKFGFSDQFRKAHIPSSMSWGHLRTRWKASKSRTAEQFCPQIGGRLPEIEIFGGQNIRKYGSYAKMNRQFARVKFGKRTRFRGLEVPRTHLDPKSRHVLVPREHLKFGIFSLESLQKGLRNFCKPRNFDGNGKFRLFATDT